MTWLFTILINGLSLFVVDWLVQGIHLAGIGPAVMAAFVLGLVNTLIRPILVFFTLPLSIFTLGLFIFIINAITFALTGWLVPGFEVSSFSGAFWGALLTSLISWLLQMLFLDR